MRSSLSCRVTALPSWQLILCPGGFAPHSGHVGFDTGIVAEDFGKIDSSVSETTFAGCQKQQPVLAVVATEFALAASDAVHEQVEETLALAD